MPEQSSSGLSAIDKLMEDFQPMPALTSLTSDYEYFDYAAMSYLQVDGMQTISPYYEMNQDIYGAFMHGDCQSRAPQLQSLDWPCNTNALGGEMRPVAPGLQVQTDVLGADTDAAAQGFSTDIASPVDSRLHFQTLSMIFADTGETQLLAELHKMDPLFASVQLPPRDATYSSLTNYFHHFDIIMPVYDEATTFHLVDLFYGAPPNSSAELASYVYSVVAISYACNIHTTSSLAEESETTAWLFFSHAAQYIPRLMASVPGLLSVQALLGMVRLDTRTHGTVLTDVFLD